MAVGNLGPVEAAEAVADFLIGSADRWPYTVAGALDQHELPAEYIDNKTFCATLDQLCFSCDACGWWCSTDELHNMDGVTEKCDDCSDETDDD
jgi:hypothetical protein